MTSQNTAPYSYYVAFNFGDGAGGSGFGATEIKAPRLISDMNAVLDIAEIIRKRNGFNAVVVMNFQLLNGPTSVQP